MNLNLNHRLHVAFTSKQIFEAGIKMKHEGAEIARKHRIILRNILK